MFVVVAFALLAGGSVPDYAPIIKAVKAQLNDPDSAKIHDIKKTGPSSYCGLVNAKNKYGGYAGDHLFYSEAGAVHILDSDEPIHNLDSLSAKMDAERAGAPGAADMKVSLNETGKKVEPCLTGHDD